MKSLPLVLGENAIMELLQEVAAQMYLEILLLELGLSPLSGSAPLPGRPARHTASRPLKFSPPLISMLRKTPPAYVQVCKTATVESTRAAFVKKEKYHSSSRPF